MGIVSFPGSGVGEKRRGVWYALLVQAQTQTMCSAEKPLQQESITLIATVCTVLSNLASHRKCIFQMLQ